MQCGNDRPSVGGRFIPPMSGDFDDFGGPFPGLRTDGTLHPRLTEGSDWFRQGPKTPFNGLV